MLLIYAEFVGLYSFLGIDFGEPDFPMAKVVNESNGLKNDSLGDKDSREVEDHANGEEDSESSSLLAPRRGGMSRTRNPQKTRRKVQWNDNHGNKLAEVLEFQPSDASDSEEDEDSDSCLCTIM